MPLYQSCEIQAMSEPPGNVSEEILFEMCKSYFICLLLLLFLLKSIAGHPV